MEWNLGLPRDRLEEDKGREAVGCHSQWGVLVEKDVWTRWRGDISDIEKERIAVARWGMVWAAVLVPVPGRAASYREVAKAGGNGMPACSTQGFIPRPTAPNVAGEIVFGLLGKFSPPPPPAHGVAIGVAVKNVWLITTHPWRLSRRKGLGR
ncbi:hypothetical protein BDK51DRAFT_30191 [Blyttiomyces helicus]|uniref:Uncharacterized protein n=1 Tax=Blyttiomyces helicus TaxID=388810 RepID=A0A4P9W5M7_9FUNG|nr:hypothetical protein BDK51DRAFT_30191 [Blyttiomyces helicus]|eukprot:RKO87721.1 hypothetical protein BDK51DRAFT_30191 [Blyttiomyces helicus]